MNFIYSVLLSVALLLKCKQSCSQRVELSDPVLSHSTQAIGSDLTVTINATVLSQEDAAIPLNWYFDEIQIWNVFMVNRVISPPTCSTTMSNCKRISLNASIIQEASPLIVQHVITIRNLQTSDNTKKLRLEYSTGSSEATLEVTACNTTVNGQAINLMQSMEVCGFGCFVFYTCGDGYSPAGNIISVCQADGTFDTPLELFQCNPSSVGGSSSCSTGCIVGLSILAIAILIIVIESMLIQRMLRCLGCGVSWFCGWCCCCISCPCESPNELVRFCFLCDCCCNCCRINSLCEIDCWESCPCCKGCNCSKCCSCCDECSCCVGYWSIECQTLQKPANYRSPQIITSEPRSNNRVCFLCDCCSNCCRISSSCEIDCWKSCPCCKGCHCSKCCSCCDECSCCVGYWSIECQTLRKPANYRSHQKESETNTKTESGSNSGSQKMKNETTIAIEPRSSNRSHQKESETNRKTESGSNSGSNETLTPGFISFRSLEKKNTV